MSGGPISVSGLRLSVTGQYTDALVCSVFHEVTSHISNEDVRNTLHRALNQGTPSERPSVTVETNHDGSAEEYIITSGTLQVTIPLSNYEVASVADVVDYAICLAITDWNKYISDQGVSNAVRYEAQSGLQTVAQHMAQAAVAKS